MRARERGWLRRALGGRTEQSGMFLAAANVPSTFQRTLMPRGTVDQGIATGVVMGMNYAIGALAQDLVDVLALKLSGAQPHRELDDARWRRTALAVGALAAGAGYGLRAALRERPGERAWRSVGRTAGGWFASGAAAGVAVGVVQEILHRVDEAAGGDPDRRSFPVALPAGAIAAAALELTRRRREAGRVKASSAVADDPEGAHVSAAKSVGLGAGVGLVLGGIAHVERVLAASIGHAVAAVLPGHGRHWRPIGHTAALGGMALGVVEAMRRVDKTIEEKASRLEPAFDAPPTSELVSGGPGSAVSWDSLSKQGRRNVSTALPKEEIERVMGEPAVAEPIRVFVGLDSAATPQGRVKLAMDELERTGAFDRELLMVISPTGTGYVNYVAVEAAEFMTRGNSASVTLQYSKRPSVLSLDRVALQKRQYRMLVESIHRRLEEGPGGPGGAARPNLAKPGKDGRAPPRQMGPRVVLFGESLGAWTSEDSFQGEGTRGLEDLGVDRAIWIGTPHETKWKDEIAAGGADVDPAVVRAFNDFGQVEALAKKDRARLRYVMITHDNDAVAKFGLSLLVRQPQWLGDPAMRPVSVPETEEYSSPTTFVLTLIDMKNAANVVPGKFEAKGHDYRKDLARFVREVYGLESTDEQLERVEVALRRDELDRKERVDERDKKPKR